MSETSVNSSFPTIPAPDVVDLFVMLPAVNKSGDRFAKLHGRVHGLTISPNLQSLWLSVTSMAVEEAGGASLVELTHGLLQHPQRLLVRALAGRPGAFTYWQVVPEDLTLVSEVTRDQAVELTPDGELRLEAVCIVLTRFTEVHCPRWRRAARKRGPLPMADQVGFSVSQMLWPSTRKSPG